MSLATVYSKTGEAVKTVHIPSVIRNAPIRPDIIQFVHSNLSKNHRQPFGRDSRAGHQHSAESWGTGRAVARVPRISGSGTARNGQAAFANFARGGHMFSALKTWRRWHRLVNVSQRRFAMCSAIAATSVTALVMARGHKIEEVPEIPLVVADDAEQIKKTKEAVAILAKLKADADVQRSADSRKIRPGMGKARNRRYIQRLGPLVVYDKNEGLSKAFRNISGISLANVNRLNLRDLAPGGHLGRFVLWTEGAFKKLDELYGTKTRTAALKNGYKHPTAQMTTTDLARIINAPEVQKKIVRRTPFRPPIPKQRGRLLLLPKRPRMGMTLTEKQKKDRAARLAAARAKPKAAKTPEKKIATTATRAANKKAAWAAAKAVKKETPKKEKAAVKAGSA